MKHLNEIKKEIEFLKKQNKEIETKLENIVLQNEVIKMYSSKNFKTKHFWEMFKKETVIEDGETTLTVGGYFVYSPIIKFERCRQIQTIMETVLSDERKELANKVLEDVKKTYYDFKQKEKQYLEASEKIKKTK